MKNQTEEICLETVKQEGYALEFCEYKTLEICLAAVRCCSGAVQDVGEQSDDDYNKIVLEAINTDGTVLEYVKNQTEEICLIAVKQIFMALEYVKNQTRELVREETSFLTPMAYKAICLIAVRQDGKVIQWVQDQTEELYFGAIMNPKFSMKWHSSNVEDEERLDYIRDPEMKEMCRKYQEGRRFLRTKACKSQ